MPATKFTDFGKNGGINIMADMITDTMVKDTVTDTVIGKKGGGQRIYLRPITVEDTDLVLKWRNSKAVVENYIYRKPISREEHLSWLNDKVGTGLVHQFIICRLEDDKPLGSIYLQNFEETNRKAEEGIFLGEREAYGKGIGTEAAKLLLEYCFKELHLHKVSARALAYNQASLRMHEKAGYRQEAYFRDELWIDGKFEDLVFLGAFNPDS